MASSPKRRSAAGRPPEGAAGEPVSGYPRLTVRLPPATKHALEALGTLRRVPVWKLLDTAVNAYVEALPADERRIVAQFTAKMGRE
jgi:hypothetical protein